VRRCLRETEVSSEKEGEREGAKDRERWREEERERERDRYRGRNRSKGRGRAIIRKKEEKIRDQNGRFFKVRALVLEFRYKFYNNNVTK